MGRQLFRCRHCKKVQTKRTEDQRYCRRDECQKARKNAWRREKYQVDPDYRANHTASTKAWLASQGGSGAYHRDYRSRRKHRSRQGEQDSERVRADDVTAERTQEPMRDRSANSDAKPGDSPVLSGRYALIACDGANSDAILVELSVISNG